MRYVDINKALPDMVVGESVIGPNGVPLITAGGRLTFRIIEGLQKRGITEILIDDKESEGIKPGGVDKGFKSPMIEALKKLDIAKIQEQAKYLVAELLGNKHSIADFQIIKDYDEYTYQHSYSVGLLAATMGYSCRFTKEEIENLTLAGLLHDLGKTSINPDIINAPRKLTDEEFIEIKKHPGTAYEMLKDNTLISATIRVAAYEHHENEDGSGYPRHVKGDNIHKFAKIIHICDVFDALTSNRPYRKPMPRTEGIKYIKEKAGTMFSKTYSEVFEACIPPYPTGSEIILEDGRTAIVVKNSTLDISNPVVRVLKTGEEDFLSEMNGHSIFA